MITIEGKYESVEATPENLDDLIAKGIVYNDPELEQKREKVLKSIRETINTLKTYYESKNKKDVADKYIKEWTKRKDNK